MIQTTTTATTTTEYEPQISPKTEMPIADTRYAENEESKVPRDNLSITTGQIIGGQDKPKRKFLIQVQQMLEKYYLMKEQDIVGL